MIDLSRYRPMGSEELAQILGVTIKEDYENKVVVFLCMLSAFTENSQFNISLNAPSSTGKTFIPTEIAKLFPPEDVREYAYCSPASFFHEAGQYNKETNTYLVDMGHKIYIFLDQPHNQLIARLRPILSHDKKEVLIKITDKTQKYGLRTKGVVIRGYPAVVFCSAGLKMDEQEATRFLLLSPEISQNKINHGIEETISRESDQENYDRSIDNNIERSLLKQRIELIKREQISIINISEPEVIRSRFLATVKTLKPRHQRDVKRLIGIIKSFALLNCWWRGKRGGIITANQDDIEEGFKLWSKISKSQEVNLPPYILGMFEEVVLKAFEYKNGSEWRSLARRKLVGVSRQDVLEWHYKAYQRMLDVHQLRLQVLPMLEKAGLIYREQDPNDRRVELIFPSKDALSSESNNSEQPGGVTGDIQGNLDLFPNPEDMV